MAPMRQTMAQMITGDYPAPPIAGLIGFQLVACSATSPTPPWRAP
jgi:hypothetical protein